MCGGADSATVLRGRDEMTGIRSRGREDGATAVEFALLFPIFIMVVFGTISFGFGFERWITVTQAAREASRFAATYPMPATGVSTWLTDVTTVAKEAADIDSSTPAADYYVCVRFVNRIGPATTPATTSVSSGSLPGATCPTTSASGLPDNAAEVTVLRKVGLNWVFGSSNVAVSGENVSRYEPRLDP
jgi:Flp pilus assembly protein TadG